jgi:hypothetical protein
MARAISLAAIAGRFLADAQPIDIGQVIRDMPAADRQKLGAALVSISTWVDQVNNALNLAQYGEAGNPLYDLYKSLPDLVVKNSAGDISAGIGVAGQALCLEWVKGGCTREYYEPFRTANALVKEHCIPVFRSAALQSSEKERLHFLALLKAGA